jgi:hypothetical protein
MARREGEPCGNPSPVHVASPSPVHVVKLSANVRGKIKYALTLSELSLAISEKP